MKIFSCLIVCHDFSGLKWHLLEVPLLLGCFVFGVTAPTCVSHGLHHWEGSSLPWWRILGEAIPGFAAALFTWLQGMWTEVELEGVGNRIFFLRLLRWFSLCFSIMEQDEWGSAETGRKALWFLLATTVQANLIWHSEARWWCSNFTPQLLLTALQRPL